MLTDGKGEVSIAITAARGLLLITIGMQMNDLVRRAVRKGVSCQVSSSSKFSEIKVSPVCRQLRSGLRWPNIASGLAPLGRFPKTLVMRGPSGVSRAIIEADISKLVKICCPSIVRAETESTWRLTASVNCNPERMWRKKRKTKQPKPIN